MPFAHTIEDSGRILIIRGSGLGSLEETFDSADRVIRSHEDGSAGQVRGLLIEVDDIALRPSPTEAMIIEECIKRVQQLMGVRIAIVATHEDKHLPAQFMAFHTTNPEVEVRVFRDPAPARAWLLAE